MRQYIETCLRAMTGFQGKFSPEMERYWGDVQIKYNACNVPMLPQNHIPMWWHECQRQNIPLEAKPLPEPKEEPKALKRETVGAK